MVEKFLSREFAEERGDGTDGEERCGIEPQMNGMDADGRGDEDWIRFVTGGLPQEFSSDPSYLRTSC